MHRTPVLAGLIAASSAHDLTGTLISIASPTPAILAAALLLAGPKPLVRATRLRCSGCSVLNVPTSVPTPTRSV